MFAGGKATPVSELASVSSCEGAHLYLSSELNNSVLVLVDIEVLSSGSVRAIAHSCNTHDQGRRRGQLSPQAVAKVNLLVETLDAQSFVFDFIVQFIMDQVRHARPKLNLHETLKSLEQFKTAANAETLAELVRKEPTATRNWHCSIKVCHNSPYTTKGRFYSGSACKYSSFAALACVVYYSRCSASCL